MRSKDEISFYIDQVLGGNINAYTNIVDQHKNKAYNLAFRICCNREEAFFGAGSWHGVAYPSMPHFRSKNINY